jgi:chemotaxis signal transduction protein
MREAFTATRSFPPVMGAASLLPQECLAFWLAGMAWGIDMRQVQALRGYGAVASLSRPAAQRQRWLELRGAMVPHLDLRVALGLPAADLAHSAVVVVVAIDARLACFTADGVLGMRRSDTTHAARRDDAYSLEIRTREGDALRLLDLDRILEAEALTACPTRPDDDWAPACAETA